MKIAKVFLLTTVLVTLTLGKEESIDSINKKIKSAKTDLQKHEKVQNKLEHTLEDLARSMVKQARKIKKLSKEQRSLEKEISLLLKDSKNKEREIKKLTKLKKDLLEDKREIEVKFIELISTNIAKTLIIEKSQDFSTNDIIKKEIYLNIKRKTEKEISAIKEEYIQKQKKADSLDLRLEKISTIIKSLKSKKERVVRLKEEEKREKLALSKQHDRYKKRLDSIVSKKRKERKLLADLDIIKGNALEKVKKREKAEKTRMAKNRTVKASNTKVKTYGSSYLAVGKKHYRGKKYKAPLDDKYAFKVTKKFGPYVDPIYNIKIHNDYITLKAGKEDTVVRSVMNGKVVFADNLQTLGHVVIVKHRNNMHTIYRNLDKISPNIRVNSTIKAREAVGRVKKELVFEVTKDGIPINPLELIYI